MAIVEYPLAEITLRGRETVIRAITLLDDALFVADELPGDAPIPARDADFEGPITLTITGPGAIHIDVWRGTDHNDGKNPWRTSDTLFPNGLTEADSPLSIATGGPVRRMDQVTWQLS